MVKDVVCGVDVNEKKSKFKSEYEGQKYYFCCVECKDSFMKSPGQYLIQNRLPIR